MFDRVRKWFTPQKAFIGAAGVAATIGATAGPSAKDLEHYYPTPPERVQYHLDDGPVNEYIRVRADYASAETKRTIEALTTPGLPKKSIAFFMARTVKQTQKLIKGVLKNPTSATYGSKAPVKKLQLDIEDIRRLAAEHSDDPAIRAHLDALKVASDNLIALFGRA